MADKQLPARFALRSQLWFRWTGKCFETATSHMQTANQLYLQTSTAKLSITVLESGKCCSGVSPKLFLMPHVCMAISP